MTLLLLALFAAAALLAIGSLAVTARDHARAALAIGRQLAACRKPEWPGPSRPHAGVSRFQLRPVSRAGTRHGAAVREVHRDLASAARIGQVRQFGPDMLRPAYLVFE